MLHCPSGEVMSRYIGYRMEGHETFLLNELLPLIAGHAKSSNTPMEVTALAALIGLATVLQSNGISRETLIECIDCSRLPAHPQQGALQ